MDANAEQRVSSTGPEASKPALKKYGELLREGKERLDVAQAGRQTDRPDLSVKVPNLRAPTAMLCSMSAVWYFSRLDMVRRGVGWCRRWRRLQRAQPDIESSMVLGKMCVGGAQFYENHGSSTLGK